MDRYIRTPEDVLRLLDGLFEVEADRWTTRAADWWDGFYADREKPVPFFVPKPDENLVSYIERGLITPGRALDLGCGPGRNALHLAAHGFEVDAVDLSPTAIAWAEDRAREAGADVRFHCGDVFALSGDPAAEAAQGGSGAASGAGTAPGAEADAAPGAGADGRSEARKEGGSGTDGGSEPGADAPLLGPYDLVYDSGCFHHLPPHRRITYLALLDRVLAPGGHLGLACFAAGDMGWEIADADFYRRRSLEGGLSYTPKSLRWIFSELTEVELRRMRDEPEDSAYFGEPFLWTALFGRET